MPPQQSDLKKTILNSSPNNWEFIDTPQTWVLWPEMLSIKTIGLSHTDAYRDIDQPDFASLPDPEHDKEMTVRLLYNGTPFDQLPAMGLDGGRIRMIKPSTDHDSGTRFLTEYEAQLSQIMSQDDFMMKQGGTIDIEIR